MADQESGKKGVVTIINKQIQIENRGSVVVNYTGKPTIPAPVFTSPNGTQVNPTAPKQASESASGQAGGNTPEKK